MKLEGFSASGAVHTELFSQAQQLSICMKVWDIWTSARPIEYRGQA